MNFDFGDYALIEQKRYYAPNEMFFHKVIGRLRPNSWVDVPVKIPATNVIHEQMEEVCLCICCGVDETEVRNTESKTCRNHKPANNPVRREDESTSRRLITSSNRMPPL
ncbi:hypothetical protein ACFFW8_16870 [Erwinia tracheiphila]